MFAVRSLIFVVLICIWSCYVKVDARDLQNCESQLNQYRKFILQAILSFEDVCETYNTRATPLVDAGLPPQIDFLGRYQPSQPKTEVWSFFKLLMAQFNDMEFTNIIRDAVIERCRAKLQLQKRDEKREAVVVGKKQRFHSWGGKRSGDEYSSTRIDNDLQQEHNDDGNLSF